MHYAFFILHLHFQRAKLQFEIILPFTARLGIMGEKGKEAWEWMQDNLRIGAAC